MKQAILLVWIWWAWFCSKQ